MRKYLLKSEHMYVIFSRFYCDQEYLYVKEVFHIVRDYIKLVKTSRTYVQWQQTFKNTEILSFE